MHSPIFYLSNKPLTTTELAEIVDLNDEVIYDKLSGKFGADYAEPVTQPDYYRGPWSLDTVNSKYYTLEQHNDETIKLTITRDHLKLFTEDYLKDLQTHMDYVANSLKENNPMIEFYPHYYSEFDKSMNILQELYVPYGGLVFVELYQDDITYIENLHSIESLIRSTAHYFNRNPEQNDYVFYLNTKLQGDYHF